MLQQLNALFPGTFASMAAPRLLKDGPGGRVVRASTKTGNEFAVKIISTTDPGDKARAKREIKLLRMFQEFKDKDLRARHICGIRDAIVTVACSAVVLECMEFGTVRDLLTNAPPEHTITDPTVASGAARLKLQLLLHLSTDALAGLAIMHTHGVCHRDIKPSNIGVTMMPSLGRIGYKIIDLGIAVKEEAKGGAPPSPPPATSRSGACLNMMTGLMTGMAELKNLRGTPLFMSPEQLDENQAVWWHSATNCRLRILTTTLLA